MSTPDADPALDPAVRRQAHIVMTQVYYRMRDILMRYYDDDGMYVEPPGVSDSRDVEGMIRSANTDVLKNLDAEVQRARGQLVKILTDVDNHKRQRIRGYNPSAPPKL